MKTLEQHFRAAIGFGAVNSNEYLGAAQWDEIVAFKAREFAAYAQSDLLSAEIKAEMAKLNAQRQVTINNDFHSNCKEIDIQLLASRLRSKPPIGRAEWAAAGLGGDPA